MGRTTTRVALAATVAVCAGGGGVARDGREAVAQTGDADPGS